MYVCIDWWKTSPHVAYNTKGAHCHSAVFQRWLAPSYFAAAMVMLHFSPKELFNFSWYESMRNSWHLVLLKDLFPIDMRWPLSLPHFITASWACQLPSITCPLQFGRTWEKKVDLPNFFQKAGNGSSHLRSSASDRRGERSRVMETESKTRGQEQKGENVLCNALFLGWLKKNCLAHVLIRSWKPVRELYVCGIARPCLIGGPASVCVWENFLQRLTFSFHHWIISLLSILSLCACLKVAPLPWKTFYLC